MEMDECPQKTIYQIPFNSHLYTEGISDFGLLI